jgi:dolichol-phosphate mannosyltransferase
VSVCAIVEGHCEDVQEFVTRVTDILGSRYRYFELMLIDNGSAPEVGLCIEALQCCVPNLRLIRLSREYSKEVALAAALDNSIADYVVIMSMETDPPMLIPTLIDHAISGFDVVIAEWDGSEESFIYRSVSAIFHRAASRILGYSLQANASYFQAFSRRVVNSIIKIRSKNRYLRCLNGVLGFRQTSVSYHRLPARTHVSTLRRLFRSGFSVMDILISNSALPLRMASMLGLLACSMNLVYIIYIFIVTLLKSNLAEGWLTTSLTHTMMFLMLFLILSVLSEYIARILDETKEQPLYFVEYETTSTVSSFDRERLNIV